MRWGLGPVFIYECLAGSRRWQAYALRSFAAAGLLVGMAVALGAWLGRRRWTTALVVGAFLPIAIGWPVFLAFVPGDGEAFFWATFTFSPLAASILLVPIQASLLAVNCAGAAVLAYTIAALGLFWLAVIGAKRAPRRPPGRIESTIHHSEHSRELARIPTLT